ncbi:hypothetical protein DFJ58DRAFT_730334 [Suillus subalutaceus]|uniref:uncharacterized protein n=1 Tax=Suillus subalutaceus TaxID=48586 RepID=UPI001B882D07|nr:uncharacterized protein DFJ58DRAFT_730334 [Suillus subalutaceus]KAG1847005.1 hypothetical protein DFJ58DRAFT_730334 [Suillus subalutaceus]
MSRTRSSKCKAAKVGRAAPQSTAKDRRKDTSKGSQPLYIASTSRTIVVSLQQPVRSFEIPIVHAEVLMDESLTNDDARITYREPELVDVIDPKTRQSYKICRVPVMKGGRMRGYVPLPQRYKDVWLELCYNIVLHTNIWELWLQEGKKTMQPITAQMVRICRQNTGSMVTQLMLARRLVVLQLVKLDYITDPGKEDVSLLNEVKVRMLRGWWNVTYDEALIDGPEYLDADPIIPQNETFFTQDLAVEDDGHAMLSLPQEMELWINGRVHAIRETFESTIKPQAFKELEEPSDFFETRYKDDEDLPDCWYEGHHPCPFFWSEKQWRWYSVGHDFSGTPIAFFDFALRRSPTYDKVEDFENDVRSIANILDEAEWDDLKQVVSKLWLGESTWREFVEYLMQEWHLDKEQCTSLDRKDEGNPFDTLEARLIFQGYIHRHSTTEADWNSNDQILWHSLGRISPQEYKPVWHWVGKTVVEDRISIKRVLKEAGGWWRRYQLQTEQALKESGREVKRHDEGMHDVPQDDPSGSAVNGI